MLLAAPTLTHTPENTDTAETDEGATTQTLWLSEGALAVVDQATAAAIEALVGLALATHHLRYGHDTGTLEIEDIGTARRSYHPLGTLRLRGWACEPVLTASGYAGVITHLVDEADGQMWPLPSVLPGDQSQIQQAYRTGTGLAELSASHREIARAGLLMTKATGSADRRLGRGTSVRATLRTPRADVIPADTGPTGTGAHWWHGEVIIRGGEQGFLHPVLIMQTEEYGPVRVGVVPAAEQLGHDTLRRLGAATGTRIEVRLRARRPVDPGTAPWVLLAVRPVTSQETDWVFPGLDSVETYWVGTPVTAAPVTAPRPEVVEPETILRRWRDTLARGGRRALTGTARATLNRDIAWLTAHASGHRAEVLSALAETASAGTTGFDGRFIPDPSGLPRAFTALALVS